jgi:DivIVA domain-containing protein
VKHTMFPRVRRVRRGYHCRQVETFFRQAQRAGSGDSEPLQAADVRRVGFELVRHGYTPAAVDARLDELEERLLGAEDTGGGRRGNRDPASDLEFLRAQLDTPYMRRFPRTGWLRRGYRLDDVDEFLDQVSGALAGDGTVTVEDVRRVAFRPKRGGYDEGAVDDTLDRVVEALILRRRAAGQTTPEERNGHVAPRQL